MARVPVGVHHFVHPGQTQPAPRVACLKDGQHQQFCLWISSRQGRIDGGGELRFCELWIVEFVSQAWVTP